MQKNQIHVRRAELVSGLQRLFGIVNEAEVDDFDAGPLEILLHHAQIAFEPRLEPLELRPVGVEADAEESDAGWFHKSSEITRNFRPATSLIYRKILPPLAGGRQSCMLTAGSTRWPVFRLKANQAALWNLNR